MADAKISALTAATTPLAGTEVVPLVQSGTTKKVAVSDLTTGRSVSASTVLIPGNNTGITTGDPVNILRFTDIDTTTAAGQPMGRIEWVSQDSGFEGVKGYIQVEATDGSPDADMYFATQHNTGAGLAKRLKLSYDGDVTALTGNFVVGTAGKGIDFSATPGTGTSELLDDYEEGIYYPNLALDSGSVTFKTTADTLSYTRIGRICVITGLLEVDSVASPTGFAGLSLPFTSANLTEFSSRAAASVVFSNSVSKNANNFSLMVAGNDNRFYFADTSGSLVTGAAAGQQFQADTAITFAFTYIVA